MKTNSKLLRILHVCMQYKHIYTIVYMNIYIHTQKRTVEFFRNQCKGSYLFKTSAALLVRYGPTLSPIVH